MALILRPAAIERSALQATTPLPHHRKFLIQIAIGVAPCPGPGHGGKPVRFAILLSFQPQIFGSSDTNMIGYFAEVSNLTDANINVPPQVKASLFLVYQSHCSINRNRRRARGCLRPTDSWL
jgi:hypothetical protein